jgi:class 3 adenylate cyclase/tetratricopeptide (TPR) repeat protein
MECPICHLEYEENQNFCRVCGSELHQTCPLCRAKIQVGDNFCGACGFGLKGDDRIKVQSQTFTTERKYVTALFADVTGYTTMSEYLDPEEVKDSMSHLFGEIAKVTAKFGGFIEEFAGDSVMVVFGSPWSHEDDPVRAIRAALEIHRVVNEVSGKMAEKQGPPLSVHIGINTGQVVTGKLHIGNGMPHLAGDSINVASRLCNLAKAYETLVGQHTYEQSEGFFTFERLEPVQVKGRTKPVPVYKVLSAKEEPSKMHRLSGHQAALIGRQPQMAQLQGFLRELLKGQGGIVAIYGEAGTGKSRIIREFKSTLDLTDVRWYEGHAYAYAENVPYYLFIDLLKRIFEIREGDPPELAKEKAEKKILATIDAKQDVAAYLGELLAVHYPELESLDIDVLKFRIRNAILVFLSALVRQGPTVFCLEDLHWADSTTLELLQFIWSKLTYPALFLCSFRPPLIIMGDSHASGLREVYREIELKDLNPPETQQMVASLLRTEEIPQSLKSFVSEKVEGNPFYVEEVVNSLIDADILYFDQGAWHFREDTHDIVLPATVQGLISARVDRLDARTKEILQEAAVIGRAFCQDILEDITAVKESTSSYLQSLQDHDIIQVESTRPDMVYSFRHAMFQETVYKGLLKKQRRDIHERVGLALEKFFQERSLESWETLAFHFQRGHSVDKAVKYLVKSGERSLKKYALEASEQYFSESFKLLSHHQHRSQAEDSLLVDILIKRCLVLYYQGRFKEMSRLLLDHLPMVESVPDPGKLGEYYAWLGHANFWHGTSLTEAYRFLHLALELGEENDNKQVVAYACGFLIKACAELGLMEEAMAQAERCRKILETMPEDYFLNMVYYSGQGYIGWFTGDKDKVRDAGLDILNYSLEINSLRCQMVGYILLGFWHFIELDTAGAVNYIQKVIDEGDPFHAICGRMLLGMMLVHTREFEAALNQLNQVIKYSKKHGTEYLKTFTNVFLGVALAAQGKLTAGLRCLESGSREFREFHRQVLCSMSETILGSVYLQLYQKSGKKSFAILCHNLWVILKNLFTAGRQAEKHLLNAVQLAQQTGAKGFLGQPYLQLGVLFKARGQRETARQYLSEALQTFTACNMKAYAQRAEDLLRTLD